MRSPMRERREEIGWTMMRLSNSLGTKPPVIGKIEAGKMSIPPKFYGRLRRIGWDPFDLAIAQEKFIRWRRDLHSSMKWGLTPSNL